MPIADSTFRFARHAIVALALLSSIVSTVARADVYDFSSDELRNRFQTLTYELRCPKCQNQNIADSNSVIASDLRDEVQRLLEDGYSDEGIRNYMTDRYGEFVLYSPAVNERTAVLWFGPLVAALGGLGGLYFWLRRRSANSVEEDSMTSVSGSPDDGRASRLARLKAEADSLEVTRDK